MDNSAKISIWSVIKRDLPNLLTYSRILLIPAFVGVFYLKGETGHYLSSGIFLVACVTDFLDGYMARIWQAQSRIGQCLDPIADKLLVATALVLLVGEQRADILPTIAILCREILVSGLREFLAELRVSMPVSGLAKCKTAVQMTAIFLLLLGPAGGALPAQILGDIMLWLAAGLTLVTGYAYLRLGIRHLQ